MDDPIISLGPWDWKHTKTSKGNTYSTLLGPHDNTHTRIYSQEGPALTLAIRTACGMLKHETFRESELRIEIPELKPASTEHILRIIQSGGDMSNKEVGELVDEIISDSAAGHDLSPETVRWYRTHKPRPKKYARPGRPPKQK